MQLSTLTFILVYVASAFACPTGQHEAITLSSIAPAPQMSFFDYYRRFSEISTAWAPAPEISHLAQGILVTCMDVRLRPESALGVKPGQVHVMRNAGGRVASLISSIVISQTLLQSSEITILHHTDCGLLGEASMIRDKIRAAVDSQTQELVDQLIIEAFPDLEQSLIDDYYILKNNPLVNSDNVRLGIWDVHTNRITEVPLPGIM